MLIKIALLMSRLPLPLLHALGWVVGWLVYGLSASYRLTFNQFLSKALQQQPMAFAGIRRRAIANAGKGLMELPHVWFAPVHKVAGQGKVFGLEHFERAAAAGKGVLFLTPHLACFEVSAQIMALKAPITVLYRPHKKPQMQALIERARSRSALSIAPADLGGVRKLLKALKAGQAVGMLPDQVPSNGEGVWAPFFGTPAYTMTLPAKLHKMTGAAIVLAVGERRACGQGFDLRLFPGPDALPEDPVQAALVINHCMETLIMQYPDQYHWGYKRFKVPAGVTPPDPNSPPMAPT